VIAFLLAATLNTSVAAPSATAYYIDALHATQAAPQPSAASYHTKVVSSGTKIDVSSYQGQLVFALGYGASMRRSVDFDAKYNAAEGILAQLNGKDTVVRMPLFNPTWGGVADWMKYGFYGPDQGSAPTTPTPSPIPTATADALSTIATVRALNPGSYSITDGGAATCSDGTPGHKLLLRALRNPDTHPLTSVVVDAQNTRFCIMDFRLGASSALSFTGFFQLDLRSVGNYWLVTDGTADFLIRALGIRTSNTHLVFSNTSFVFQ